MTTAKCENCYFSLFEEEYDYDIDYSKYVSAYFCRYNPPQLATLSSERGSQILSQFPIVEKDSWCGKHQHKDKLVDAVLKHESING